MMNFWRRKGSTLLNRHARRGASEPCHAWFHGELALHVYCAFPKPKNKWIKRNICLDYRFCLISPCAVCESVAIRHSSHYPPPPESETNHPCLASYLPPLATRFELLTMGPPAPPAKAKDGSVNGDCKHGAGTGKRPAMAPPSPTPSANSSSGIVSPIKRRRGPSITGVW